MITLAQQQVCRPQARSTCHHRQIGLRSSASWGWQQSSYKAPSRHSGPSLCLSSSVSMNPLNLELASAGWTRCPRLHHARRRGVVRQRSVLPWLHVARPEPIPIMQAITASIFGVGAPEAVLVGVVALVVFGPRGLAQASGALHFLEGCEHTGQHTSRLSLAETGACRSTQSSVRTAPKRTSCCLHSGHLCSPIQPPSPGCRLPRAWGPACEALPLS